MPVITNIEDLRQIARRRIPRAIYDYVERGSYDERTLTSNRDDLNAIRLRQRVLIDVSEVSMASTMLGEKVSMPIALAPTGLMGLVHGDGEMLAARAALASEASGQRGNSKVRAPDTRPEPGSSARRAGERSERPARQL